LRAFLLARRFTPLLTLVLRLLYLLHLLCALRLLGALRVLYLLHLLHLLHLRRALSLRRQRAWTLLVRHALPLPLRHRGRNGRDELHLRLWARLPIAGCIDIAPRLRQHRL
jgi:hypothetical protein